MSEPPRLPPQDNEGAAAEPVSADVAGRERAGGLDEPPGLRSGEVNPFAPSVAQSPTPASSFGTTDLPLTYWLMLVFLLPILVGLIYVAPGLGIPGALALLGAAIRVPMLQLRLSRGRPVESLPNPLTLLVTSFLFILIMGIASIVAFCIVCIPSGFLALSANSEGTLFPIMLGFSVLSALVVFISMFVLSLRLSV